MRFTRLASTNVAFQAHVREDSHFAILPVMPPSQIQEWVIYDVQTGQIISDQPFRNFAEAKSWLNVHKE